MQVEVGNLRAEMHDEIGQLRTEMHEEIGQLRADIGKLSERVARIETALQTHYGPLPGP